MNIFYSPIPTSATLCLLSGYPFCNLLLLLIAMKAAKLHFVKKKRVRKVAKPFKSCPQASLSLTDMLILSEIKKNRCIATNQSIVPN